MFNDGPAEIVLHMELSEWVEKGRKCQLIVPKVIRFDTAIKWYKITSETITLFDNKINKCNKVIVNEVMYNLTLILNMNFHNVKHKWDKSLTTFVPNKMT